MKYRASLVMTTIPALPAKFVRYSTLAREVTMSPSTPSAARRARRASWRRLSAALGANDMDGGEETLKRAKHAVGTLACTRGLEVANGRRHVLEKLT